MWQRFTERARRVILLGQEEAGKLSASHVGTEHLLLGLVREEEGVAAQILKKMGVSVDSVRAQVSAESKTGDETAMSEPRLTPKAKRILELSADEARRMRHNYIGTEHVLLALLRQKEGFAYRILTQHGLDLEQVRATVLHYLDPSGPGPAAAPTAPSVAQTAGSAPQGSSDRLLAVLLLQWLTEDDGVPARLLRECGLDLARARALLARFANGE